MAYLGACGRYLPERIVDNRALADKLGVSPDWIQDVSGIRERRYAAPGETVVSMGAAAGADCLRRAGVETSSIGMVIVATGTSDRRFPGPAAAIAKQLGLAGIPAIDMPLASAGSLFALAAADAFAASVGTVLVIGVERLSPILEGVEHPAGTAILFGDGAGAVLVNRDSGWARITGIAIHSDGSYSDDLRLDFAGPIQMEGRSVILQAIRKLPAVIQEVLAQCGRRQDEVEVFLPHQANLNLLARIAAALDIDPQRFFTNIAEFGNTSSASMLIAASAWREARTLAAGRLACFVAFGAGFHWGAVLAEGTGAA